MIDLLLSDGAQYVYIGAVVILFGVLAGMRAARKDGDA